MPEQVDEAMDGATSGVTVRDGRVLIHREVVSYSRRDARIDRRKQKAWDADHARHLIDPSRDLRDTSVAPDWRLDPANAFGHAGERRPLVVEVGSGTGEPLLASARARRDVDHLGIEVYLPGVAGTLIKAAREGLENVRLLSAEALAVIRTALPPGSVRELWVFFPDPWPKARHHKRRLVATPFLDAAARVLEPGAVLRLATDWVDYAEQMRTVGMAHPAFENPCAGQQITEDDPVGGWSPRFDRASTRFERKGIRLGRTIRDLTFVRRPGWEPSSG